MSKEIRFPYMNKSELALALGISKTTCHIRSNEMQEYGKDRYGDLAVIRDGQIVLVNSLCFLDWMGHRRELMEPSLAKYVPEFDAKKLAQSMGWEIDRITLRRPKYVS